MIGDDALETLDDAAEAVGEVHEFLGEGVVGGFAGEAGDVFEAGFAPKAINSSVFFDSCLEIGRRGDIPIIDDE